MEKGKYLNVSKIKRNRIISKILLKTFRTILILGLSFVILYPMMVAIIPAITEYNYLGQPNSIWLPQKTGFLSFDIATYLLEYKTSIFLSIGFAASMTAIQIIVSAFVGYGFAKLKFRGNTIVFALVILTIVLPPQAIMLPQFLNFKSLGLLGNISTIYLLAFTGQGLKSGLFIYLFRQFFKGLPDELEEAALIDGCGFFKTFYKIMLPTAGSIMLTVGVFSFVWNYSDLHYTNLFAGNTNLISNLLSQKFLNEGVIQNTYQEFTNLSKENMNPLFIGSVRGAGMSLYILPLAVLYFIIQRKFVQGFERSGITGQ